MSDGTLERLERDYPFIPWREPIEVVLTQRSGYACRICIANDGLNGRDADKLVDDPDDVRAHVIEAHG